MMTIPYVVYEGTQTRNERIIKRLVVVVILTVVLLFASNALWLWAWMQYDYSGQDIEESYKYSQDGAGYNNINTGMQGDVTNGANIDDTQSTEDSSTDEK